MKTSLQPSLRLGFAALVTAALSSLIPFNAANANFDRLEVEQENFIAVAAPVGQTLGFQLLILEQVSDSQLCWSESNNSPILVDPLLLDFDFSGICGRSTDSNGYSIRVDDEDWGLDYALRIYREGNDLVLKGVPFSQGEEAFEIGRTYGVASDFLKIELHPGWRFTRRSYQGRPLGHIYLTYDRT
ncbi:MAG: DUF3747 domain-containing protein [Cyanobacteriota bacterium]|nr:DUF3747 domain-containing protein [Cyanobacteriota bacterium]